MTRVLALLLLTLIALSGVVSAQDAESTPPPEPVAVEVTVGSETTYPLDPQHPLIFYVDRMVITNDGVWIEPRVFLRTDDGFVPLTPCDDLTVSCESVPVRVEGALGGVPQGTSFGLIRLPE